jgi:endoglycosylceramidase
MRRPAFALALVSLVSSSLSLLCAGCGDDASPADAGPLDAGRADAGPRELDSCAEPAGPFAPLAPRCRQLVDEDGRVVFLRGVNARVEGLFDVSFDDGRTTLEPIPPFGPSDATRMRALGLNVLRLPINWSAVEPTDTTPSTFSATYLDTLARVVDDCRTAGVYVLIDWHEDAYSKEIGEDGAPLWAIEPAPTTLLEGPLTDLGERRISAQTGAAFATFFGDGAAGERLRARFAAAAAHVAERFAGDDAVVGYELYNEPVATDAQVRRLNEDVGAAIRAVDATHPIFFEPPVIPRNVTDSAARPAAPFALAGSVYSPHIYTLAFIATDAQRQNFTRRTLEESHANAVREAAAWGSTLFVGEWGYDPAGIRAEDYYTTQVDLFDEYGESWAYWVWKEQSQGSWGLHDYDAVTDTWSERPMVRRALSRPRAERIAGWPRAMRYDPVARRFELRFDGDAAITAPTELYVPEPADFAASFAITCDGAAVDAPRDAATGLVAVSCAGAGLHTLVLEAR